MTDDILNLNVFASYNSGDHMATLAGGRIASPSIKASFSDVELPWLILISRSTVVRSADSGATTVVSTIYRMSDGCKASRHAFSDHGRPQRGGPAGRGSIINENHRDHHRNNYHRPKRGEQQKVQRGPKHESLRHPKFTWISLHV